LAIAALLTSACAAREGDDIGSPIFNGTTPTGEAVEPPFTTLPAPTVDAIRVPVEATTIQSAVDQAQPGDLILIEPGVYNEEVFVTTPDVVIRGRNRNTVFVDGAHGQTTGFTVLADGVAIENMTVRNYAGDAIIVSGAGEGIPRNRFRALHVTTSNSAGSGIALENATNVEIRQGWFSGHGDAGVSVRDCSQCATLITTSLAEYNARGYSVTGTADGVTIYSATSRNNRTGITIEDHPLRATSGVVVAGNLIQNNGFTQSPNNNDAWDMTFGVGIHVGGTFETSVVANRIEGNTRTALLLGHAVAGSGDPIAALAERNNATGHPEGDIVFAFTGGVIDPGLCVTENEGAVLLPAGADSAAGCSDTNTAPATFSWSDQGPRPSIPHQNVSVPPEIDGMVDADTAIAVPAGAIQLPDPSGAEVPS